VRVVPGFGGSRQSKPDRARDDFKLTRTKAGPGIGVLALIGIGAGIGAFNTSLRVKSPAPLHSPPVIVRDPRGAQWTGPWPPLPPSYGAPTPSAPSPGATWVVPGPGPYGPSAIHPTPGHV